MTTSNKIAYVASAQITCSLASLASGSTRESAVVVNDTSTADNLAAQVSVCFTIASGTPTSSGAYVNVYVAATEDGTNWPIIQKSDGTTYTTGTGDTSVGALGQPTGLRLIGVWPVMTTTSSAERTLRTLPFPVEPAFAGVLVRKWSIFIENQTGVAFSTSTVTTANYLSYTPEYTTNS